MEHEVVQFDKKTLILRDEPPELHIRVLDTQTGPVLVFDAKPDGDYAKVPVYLAGMLDGVRGQAALIEGEDKRLRLEIPLMPKGMIAAKEQPNGTV